TREEFRSLREICPRVKEGSADCFEDRDRAREPLELGGFEALETPALLRAKQLHRMLFDEDLTGASARAKPRGEIHRRTDGDRLDARSRDDRSDRHFAA